MSPLSGHALNCEATRQEIDRLRGMVILLKAFVRSLAVEHADKRLGYVTLQAAREDYNEARKLIGLGPVEDTSPIGGGAK